MKRTLFVLAGILCAAIFLGACGRSLESSAPEATDFSGAQILAMPHDFRNVAIKCAFLQGEWFAVATTSASGQDNLAAGVAVTPDPHCTHYGGH